MSSFFEFRVYQVKPGKMKQWVKFMETVIIPFQTSKGMIIHGSFIEKSLDQFCLVNGERKMISKKDTKNYIWVRRFENEEHKKKLYKNVYQSSKWINEIAPKVEKLIDRNTIIIHNLISTELSIMK